jgi:hypothetical protein
MKIGEVLTYNGRTYVLLGLEPMSVPDRRVELEDTQTGDIVSVPYALLAQSSEGLSEHH